MIVVVIISSFGIVIVIVFGIGIDGVIDSWPREMHPISGVGGGDGGMFPNSNGLGTKVVLFRVARVDCLFLLQDYESW